MSQAFFLYDTDYGIKPCWLDNVYGYSVSYKGMLSWATVDASQAFIWYDNGTDLKTCIYEMWLKY